MYSKFTIAFITGLLTTLSPISNTFAAEQIKLVTLAYPPYQYRENGEITGMVVDIINEAFDRLNITPSIEMHPWPRSLLMVQKGKRDAIFTAYKNEERLKFLDYSKTILMPQKVVLFVHPDSNIQFTGDLSQIKDKRIGIVRGISYGSIFDTAKKSGTFSRLDESTTIDQNARKFANKRFDIFISNRYSALALFKKLNMLDKVLELSTPVQSVPSYIAFSKRKNLTKLRDRFDDVLSEMISDGTYDRLVHKYAK